MIDFQLVIIELFRYITCGNPYKVQVWLQLYADCLYITRPKDRIAVNNYVNVKTLYLADTAERRPCNGTYWTLCCSLIYRPALCSSLSIPLNWSIWLTWTHCFCCCTVNDFGIRFRGSRAVRDLWYVQGKGLLVTWVCCSDATILIVMYNVSLLGAVLLVIMQRATLHMFYASLQIDGCRTYCIDHYIAYFFIFVHKPYWR